MSDIRGGGIWWDLEVRGKNFDAAIAAQAAKGVAGEKKVQAAAKSANVPYDERIAKMHELLGLSEKQAVADQAAATKMSMLDRTMAGMGAKINKGGMMGAQLSYAAQDFLTGLSMGNLNMALMGASNNLGMMAMQISSAAAVWTTLGLVAIPLAITAMKAFGQAQKEVLTDAELMHRAFERRRFDIGLEAKARQALTKEEVQRIRGAANAQRHIEGEERSVKDLNSAIEDETKLLNSADLRVRGLGAIEGIIPPKAVQYAKTRADIKRLGRPSPVDEEVLLKQLGLSRGTHMLTEGPRGELVARRRVSEDEKKEAEKQFQTSKDRIKEFEEERRRRESDLELLRVRQVEEAKKEIEFRRREGAAGFNKYQQGLIRLDREREQEEDKLRDMGLDKILLRPQMTKDEFQKKQKEIDEKAQEDSDNVIKEMDTTRERKRLRGRLLTEKETAAFMQQREDIEKNRQKAQEDLEEEYVGGPPTMMGPGKAMLDEEFRRKRLDLASGIAQGRTGISGIADLNRQIQTGLLGSGGMKTAEQTAANTQAMNQAFQDIVRNGIKIKNPGDIGGGPAKWGPN